MFRSKGQGHIAQDTENKIQIRKMIMAPVIWQVSEIHHQKCYWRTPHIEIS